MKIEDVNQSHVAGLVSLLSDMEDNEDNESTIQAVQALLEVAQSRPAPRPLGWYLVKWRSVSYTSESVLWWNGEGFGFYHDYDGDNFPYADSQFTSIEPLQKAPSVRRSQLVNIAQAVSVETARGGTLVNALETVLDEHFNLI